MTQLAKPPAIDLDNLSSNAIRALAAARADLEARVAEHQDRAQGEAAELNKQQLIGKINELAPHIATKESGPKSGLVAMFVELSGTQSEPGRELRRLQDAVRADSEMARRLNGLLTRAHSELERLTPKQIDTREVTIYDVAYLLRSNVDSFLIATEAAHYAEAVVNAVGRGDDIREATAKLVKPATRAVVSAVPHVAANGFAGTRRAEEIHKAVGARDFLREVAFSYGWDDSTDMSCSLLDLNF